MKELAELIGIAIEETEQALRERQHYAKEAEWTATGDEWPAFHLQRRCAADRKIVEHFRLIETLVNDPDPADRPISPAALTVLRPVIRLLAEGYGLTTNDDGADHA